MINQPIFKRYKPPGLALKDKLFSMFLGGGIPQCLPFWLHIWFKENKVLLISLFSSQYIWSLAFLLCYLLRISYPGTQSSFYYFSANVKSCKFEVGFPLPKFHMNPPELKQKAQIYLWCSSSLPVLYVSCIPRLSWDSAFSPPPSQVTLVSPFSWACLWALHLAP